MKIKDCLKFLNIKNEKSSNTLHGCTYYHITYDYDDIITNWNKIFELLDTKSNGKKYIKTLEEYSSLEEFNKDLNKVLIQTITPSRASCCSFSYTYLNKDIIIDIRNKIFKKMLSLENISKFENPYIFIVEKNKLENQLFKFGIKITKDNYEDLVKLQLNFYNLYENGLFHFSSSILEEKNIEWNTQGKYMQSPKKITKHFDSSLLEAKTKEKLSLQISSFVSEEI